MPTHILGIKDSKTPSFKLILKPQKETFQVISARTLTILVVQHQEVLIFPLLVIMLYCLYFLHGHYCFSMTDFRADLHGPVHLQPSFCYRSFLVILSLPYLQMDYSIVVATSSILPFFFFPLSFSQNLLNCVECFRAFFVYENGCIFCKTYLGF